METRRLFLLASLLTVSLAVDMANLGHIDIQDSIETTVTKWKAMEKGVKNAIDSVIKQALPVMLRSGAEVQPSPECMADLLRAVVDLRELKLWPIQMLDSIGKPEGGQLQATISAFGSYTGCLNITLPVRQRNSDKPTVGQYCKLDFFLPMPPKPKRLRLFQDVMNNASFDSEVFQELSRNAFAFYEGGFRIGICLPSTCSKNDTQLMIDAGMKVLGGKARVTSCEIKEPYVYDTVQLSILGFVIALVIICILATIGDNVLDDKSKSVPRELLRIFSINRNFEALVHTVPRQPGELLAELNGMRFLSMTWVILGHTYISIEPFFLRQALAVLDERGNWPFQVVFNAYFSVYTFFFIASVLVSYNLVKSFDASGYRVFNIPILIFRRFWRLAPSLMMVIGVAMLLPATTTGPQWLESTNFAYKCCRTNWWHNLLFIHNYFPVAYNCMPHTWYLAVDFQLFVVSMFYFLLLFRRPVLGRAFLVFLIVGSLVSTGAVIYIFEFLPSFLLLTADIQFGFDFFLYHYNSTYVELGVYAIGLGLGTFMARAKKVQIKKLQVIAGWLISIASGLTLVYGVRTWNAGKYPSMLESIIYGSLHRPAWAICLCWVVLACSYGYGGPVARFLGWPGWQPLVRLSYLVYLIHFVLLFAYSASRQGPIDASHSSMVWLFFGHLVASHIAAAFIRIFFEGPMMSLDKLVFRGRTTRMEPIETVKVITKDDLITKEDLKATNGDTSRL